MAHGRRGSAGQPSPEDLAPLALRQGAIGVARSWLFTRNPLDFGGGFSYMPAHIAVPERT